MGKAITGIQRIGTHGFYKDGITTPTPPKKNGGFWAWLCDDFIGKDYGTEKKTGENM